MRKKRKSRGLQALGWSMAALGALLFGVLVYTGFRATNLLPQWVGYQWAAVTQDDMGEALPQGALAIIDCDRPPEPREVAAYRTAEGASAFGRVASVQDGEYRLVSEQGNEIATVREGDLLGSVHLYVSGLGSAVEFLRAYRLTVAAAGVLYVALLLVLLFTKGPRRRAKRRRELIDLFAYYGEKYDMEESGIEY